MSTQEEQRKAKGLVNIRIVGLDNRSTALRSLFVAACFMQNGEEADRIRQDMHQALDEVLDALGENATLTRRECEL